jgi:hypothetical protein
LLELFFSILQKPAGGRLFFSDFDAVTVQGTGNRLKAGLIASLVALGTNVSVLKYPSSEKYIVTTSLSPKDCDNSLSLLSACRYLEGMLDLEPDFAWVYWVKPVALVGRWFREFRRDKNRDFIWNPW